MKLSNSTLLFLSFFVSSGWAQEIPSEEGDYMFPIRPKQENYLAGTMGELRSTHFHTGLDIKTSGITGLPVYATADGYVQRVKVSSAGYGNALYMMHPKLGTVSVYAHLKSFHHDVAEYVRFEQYEEESHEVNLFPEKDRFSFKKGAVIALSGNSGSSSGPHLHFEIRNTKHEALDPLNFGFKEIVDNLPPVLSKIAFVTMDMDSRVNGMYGRIEFNLKTNQNGIPIVEESISIYGNVGVEIYAYDKLDGARNKNGIRFQTLLLDGESQFEQSIDKLNFSKGRNILAHTNYKRFSEGGRRFNKLYIDRGNQLDFYQTNGDLGILKITDPMEHQIQIRLEDAYKNITQVNIPVNVNGFSRSRKLKNTYGLDHEGFDIVGDILELEAEGGDCGIAYYFGDSVVRRGRTFYTDVSNNFLWDLSEGLPDSALLCGKTYAFNFSSRIPSGQKIHWKGEGISITFPRNALFDNIYLRYKKEENTEGQEIFGLKNPHSPLKQFAIIHLKPDGVYDMMKAGVYAVNAKGKLNYVGGKWENDELVFKTRNLISYTIATDTIPPSIESKAARKGQVKFRIKDKQSGINSLRASLNGEWLLMNFDAKYGNIRSDELVVISGHFKLAVKDNANNITRYEADY